MACFEGRQTRDLVPNLPFTSKVAVLAIMAAHNKDVLDEVFATLKQRREMWRCMELWYVVMKPLCYLIEFHAIPIAAFRASCVCILKYMIDLKYIHKNYPLYGSVPCCLPMPPSLLFLLISKDRVDFMMELRFALEVAQSRSLPALLCRFLLSPKRRIFPPNKNNALMSFGTCGGFEHWPWFLRHARPKYMFAEYDVYIYI